MGHLELELVKLLISLLNLLVQSLVLNLELLVIDQMESISQLLSLSQNFLLVSQLISECNVLQSVLVDLLVLGFIGFLPLFDHFLGQFLAMLNYQTEKANESMLLHTLFTKRQLIADPFVALL